MKNDHQPLAPYWDQKKKKNKSDLNLLTLSEECFSSTHLSHDQDRKTCWPWVRNAHLPLFPIERAKLPIFKMITKVLLFALALPLCVIFFVLWWRFWYTIKMMADVESILNDNELFADTNDIPKESIESHRERECSKTAKSKYKLTY